MKKGRVIIIYDRDELNSEGRLTGSVLIICIAVALAGITFGYDTFITGTITRMEPFMKKFFPPRLHSQHNAKSVNHSCVSYTSKVIGYVSSLYIAGMFSALLAGRLTTSAGRKGALIIGGITYLIGLSLHALAVNIGMLILGRTLAGFGIGFTNQTVPIYLAEMAPTKWRGSIGTGFRIFFWIGATIASWLNYYFKPSLDSNNWRIASCLSGFPAAVMTIIAFFIPDTPSSLIQRGKVKQALKSLNQVRRISADAENELKYLIKYNEDMRIASETPYKMLLERKYRPHLVFTVALASFQLLTGANWNNLIGIVIIRSLRISLKEALPISLVEGIVFFLSIFVATYLVDRVGRRPLLIQGGCQIFICQLLLAVLRASESESESSHYSLFSKRSAVMVLFLRGFIGVAVSWSWGPLTSILTCEILPMEVRSAGQGLSTAINFAFHFITIQTAYPMLCSFKYEIFLFYAGWTLIMTVFVVLFLPETKRISLESMDIIWHSHWYWHRFVDQTKLKSESIELSKSESVESLESDQLES